MIARHVNLGRVVIVIGGVLAFAALIGLAFAHGERPWIWTGVLASVAVGFTGVLLIGRAVGGLVARRLAADVEEGRRAGLQLTALTVAVGTGLWRWLTSV
jgi:hypothetical protein